MLGHISGLLSGNEGLERTEDDLCSLISCTTDLIISSNSFDSSSDQTAPSSLSAVENSSSDISTENHDLSGPECPADKTTDIEQYYVSPPPRPNRTITYKDGLEQNQTSNSKKNRHRLSHFKESNSSKVENGLSEKIINQKKLLNRQLLQEDPLLSSRSTKIHLDPHQDNFISSRMSTDSKSKIGTRPEANPECQDTTQMCSTIQYNLNTAGKSQREQRHQVILQSKSEHCFKYPTTVNKADSNIQNNEYEQVRKIGKEKNNPIPPKSQSLPENEDLQIKFNAGSSTAYNMFTSNMNCLTNTANYHANMENSKRMNIEKQYCNSSGRYTNQHCISTDL